VTLNYVSAANTAATGSDYAICPYDTDSHLACDTATIRYTYDAQYRLTRADYVGGPYFRYAYDAAGNRTQEVVCASLPTCTPITTPYTYDNANRLIEVTTGLTATTFAYNGLVDRVNQTVAGVVTTYTLDLNTGLTQVLADGTHTYLYGYGPLRVAQDDGADVVYFLRHTQALRHFLGPIRTLTLRAICAHLLAQLAPICG
jgi:YD repeat-containing protein